MKSRFIEAPARLSAARKPQGTLVLIHAFPLNARMWEPQLALADAGWRIIAPQLRGFDSGSAGAHVDSIDDYAGDVIDLLDSLHVEEAVIGGLSMGGYVTFAMLRHAPRYFRGLVLADTRAGADSPEAAQGRRQMIGLVREKGPSAVADEMLPRLLGPSTQRNHPDLVDTVRGLVLSNSADAMAAALGAMMTRPDSTPLLPSIHVPTLILVGDEDSVTPPSVSSALHQAIAGSELVTVPQAGHLSSLEQPAVFTAALSRFLNHRV